VRVVDEDSGTWSIEVVDYACSVCEARAGLGNYDPTPDENGAVRTIKCTNRKCSAARTAMVPDEIVECSNGCEDARRTTLWDGDWRVSRAGSSTSTSYNFQFLGVSAPEEWEGEHEPIDLKMEYRPFSSRKLAEILGVEDVTAGGRVPAASGSDTESYDDEPDVAAEEGEDLSYT
jgi:hypothetical protein